VRDVATTTLVTGARAARTTIALKLAMAASGILFILFVLAHMYGNLKAFAGESAYNEYAHHLRTIGEPMLPYSGLLWILRVGLIAALVIHVGAAVALTRRAHKARPVKYVVKKNKGSSLSSRTMRWGGLALLLFIIWHLIEFTIVKVPLKSGVDKDNAYQMLVTTFTAQGGWMTAIYLLALLALAFHLHHGTFSALQTLGLTNSERQRTNARTAGWAVAVVIAGGFALVPLFTIFHVIK